MNYHVKVETTDGDTEVRLGMSNVEVNERVIAPYNAGHPIVVNGRVISPSELARVRIAKSEASPQELTATVRSQHAADAIDGIFHYSSEESDAFELAEDVTDSIITRPPGAFSEPVSEPTSQADPLEQPTSDQPDPRKVFVIHGRNTQIRDSAFSFLRSINLAPIEWNEAVRATGQGTPYVGDILDAAFSGQRRSSPFLPLMTKHD